MSSLPSGSQIGVRGVAGAWALAAGGSLIVNLILFALAHALFTVPVRFQPLASPIFVVTYTLLGTLGAALTLGILLVLSTRSLRAFRWGLAVTAFVLALGAFALGTVAPLPILALLGLAIAAALFVVAGRLWRRPTAAFVTVAALMLLVSFVPDLSMLVGPVAPLVLRAWGPTPELVGTLMAMHVCTGLVVVGAVTWVLRRPRPEGIHPAI